MYTHCVLRPRWYATPTPNTTDCTACAVRVAAPLVGYLRAACARTRSTTPPLRLHGFTLQVADQFYLVALRGLLRSLDCRSSAPPAHTAAVTTAATLPARLLPAVATHCSFGCRWSLYHRFHVAFCHHCRLQCWCGVDLRSLPFRTLRRLRCRCHFARCRFLPASFSARAFCCVPATLRSAVVRSAATLRCGCRYTPALPFTVRCGALILRVPR